MDVHLLSRLLKELIIDNDRIALPGMGYFQAEPMPAYFSEDGKTIYPPSKRISFKWDDRASGDMLAAYYTKTYGIDRNTADIELDTFLKQLKPMLHERKFIDFPGVGRLKLTLDGSAYFVTDNTDGGVFSQAFGFEPVILKPVTRSSESTSHTQPGAGTGTRKARTCSGKRHHHSRRTKQDMDHTAVCRSGHNNSRCHPYLARTQRPS